MLYDWLVAQNSRMAKPASDIPPQASAAVKHYEQPLSERMRTFLRLEFLYQQMLYNSERQADWATRATIATLLEALAILSRGDVRSDVHKELDHQLGILERFQSKPGVDGGRLDTLIHNLAASRNELSQIGTSFLQPLKDSEFLNAIKHRSAIPGGTCEFDLPDYGHWLHQEYATRAEDLESWLVTLRPLCDGVAELLWLTRAGAEHQEEIAAGGLFQHGLPRGSHKELLRVTLPGESGLFPEISGNQHRFTIRFLRWQAVDKRPAQISKDVPFVLGVC